MDNVIPSMIGMQTPIAAGNVVPQVPVGSTPLDIVTRSTGLFWRQR